MIMGSRKQIQAFSNSTSLQITLPKSNDQEAWGLRVDMPSRSKVVINANPGRGNVGPFHAFT